MSPFLAVSPVGAPGGLLSGVALLVDAMPTPIAFTARTWKS